MKNLKDAKTTIYPSTTRGGKELPSSSALDSPSVMSKLATPKPAPAIRSDMSHFIDDATSAMHDTYDETASMPDTTVPLSEFLDEQIARARQKEIIESEYNDESDDEDMPVIPEGYVFDMESSAAILACKDSTQVEQVLKAQKEVLDEMNSKKNDYAVRVATRTGRMTQEPLYPEGHPKRIEQDSQINNIDVPSSSKKKKKKNDRTVQTSSEPIAEPLDNPNDIFMSDAETQSGNEHEPSENINDDVHNDAQPSNDNDVEAEPAIDLDNPQSKNQRYDKRDFVANKHGKEREPWVQKPMPFSPKPSEKKDDEDFERFAEMIRPIFLLMRLTDMLKMNPYAKYMKDIVTNKRKIPEAEISTMLANYTFKGGIPKKLGDPGIPTIPCSTKRNYIKTALCDLGAGVSVMPLSLYRRLDLNKLTPTEISLQMADKSTAIPVSICEDVPVVVANVTILTDFVILNIPEDDSMSIILGRPFLNTAGAVIDCNKGNVTFHVNGNKHTVHFPRKQPQVHSINSIGKIPSIIFGGFEFPLPTVKKKYDILIIGDVHIPVEVT
ncbi:unnamed protein product [Triticum aestivum]|uniref:Uncharacterized protein n=1 Tax=Triticum aestivum TaxID=4565 RepID=A0A7H4LPQ1_WHEAT|nr:unnamed protein product [Triticum aestivum]